MKDRTAIMNTKIITFVKNGFTTGKNALKNVGKFFGIKAGEQLKPLEKDTIDLKTSIKAFTAGPTAHEVVHYSPQLGPYPKKLDLNLSEADNEALNLMLKKASEVEKAAPISKYATTNKIDNEVISK